MGAALLAMGFMTRYAAAALLGLSLVIQIAYQPFDSQLFWAALFAWYTVSGAGPLSIDNLLRRGLANSALPAVPSILRASEWIRGHLGPAYISALRIWLALTLLTVALPSMLPSLQVSSWLAAWLPVQVAARVPADAALAVGVLLLFGLATRYVGLAMIIALFTDAMMDPRAGDAAYLLMVFFHPDRLRWWCDLVGSTHRTAIGQTLSSDESAKPSSAGRLAESAHCRRRFRRG